MNDPQDNATYTLRPEEGRAPAPDEAHASLTGEEIPAGRRRSSPALPGAAEIILFLLILAAAAFLRTRGLLWGEYQYLHPDERFLIWVGADIRPVGNLGEYFDTANSSLNPHNRGHGFYVYGTLPMFLARYTAEAFFESVGWVEMTQAGRSLSALADLGTVILTFAIARTLFGRRRGGSWAALLAMAFSAAAVLQIQQAHFFTMDTFAAFFSTLALYFAAVVSMRTAEQSVGRPALLFGLALGLAVASKINTAPVAAALALGFALHHSRLPEGERERRSLRLLLWLGAAALVSVAVFRLLQPYAFSGPGLFGVALNPAWVENIRTQRAQASPDFDFPPNMQWARRPVWFSLQNMVVWGLGLPLGILAWAGFALAGLRLLTALKRDPDEWRSLVLIWTWTGAYFAWQSLQLNPTMRYQLPIYPTLAIFAGWAVWMLHRSGADDSTAGPTPPRRARQAAAWAIGGAALLLTFAYAYAFSGIYTRPVTRIAATRWIYANIPGPINLPIRTDTGGANQILPVAYAARLDPEHPFQASFQPKTAGLLDEIYLPRVHDEAAFPRPVTIRARMFSSDSPVEPIAAAELSTTLTPDENGRGRPYTLALDRQVGLDPAKSYVLRLEVDGPPSKPFTGRVAAALYPPDPNEALFPVIQELEALDPALQSRSQLRFHLTPTIDGRLSLIRIESGADPEHPGGPEPLSITIESTIENAEVSLSALTYEEIDPQGWMVFSLQEPPQLNRGETYRVAVDILPVGTSIAIGGVPIANEGDWDDGLPLRMDGYDGYAGIYPPELNFNMYWDDNPEKLERFVRILDEAEYIAISSNRQWGSLPRLPERFPMTTLYYRALLGCPDGLSVEHCYRVAEPGTFQGGLGFELVQTFTSEPRLGRFALNDQYAEEAFSVYDHPKVLIFRKTDRFNAGQARALLETVDFDQVVRVAPLKAGPYPATLLLPAERLAEQQAGGTWRELFDTNAAINRSPALAAAVWYLTIMLLGWAAYPVLRLATASLDDRGYPLARTAGMLLLAYPAWLAGSARIPVTRPLIAAVFGLLVAAGAFLAYRRRAEIRAELRARRGYYLAVEGLFLMFFAAFLLVRLGNPDLWHPWKGGEKPMDFAYFNAVLRSTTFPPYDPWYAGGYLNYYYFGFVLAGMPVKLLGIVPAAAYNLILPTVFSLIAMGAFSAAWNLAQANRHRREDEAAAESGSGPDPSPPEEGPPHPVRGAYLPALVGALLMAVLGNLGTVRMIYQGFQRLASPTGDITDAALPTLWVWAVRGFVRVLGGERLPYAVGDWYWIPSRAIPAPGEVEPITEFPYFTVLYADLHAHLLALPLALLTLGLILALVIGGLKWRRPAALAAWLGLTALTLGALRPTNTWDMPAYLALGVVAILYTAVRRRQPPEPRQLPVELKLPIPLAARPLAAGMLAAGMLAGLAFLFFRPYAQWYALAYTKIDLWSGLTTPAYSYLIHWGLFLFIIVSWLVYESLDWMDSTPVSALTRLVPYRRGIQAGLLSLGLFVIALYFGMSLYIAWIVIPLGIWVTVLLFRPDQPDARRAMLFMVGVGLALTLMVEVIVLVGDIGRMNTVFKFYLQVWTLFAVVAAAALGRLLPGMRGWRSDGRTLWELALLTLAAGAFLYTFMATMAKIEDRMTPGAPRSLDGMAYMRTSTYTDTWGPMDLSQDYNAIRWLQENVDGSPVIVEANLRDLYRWGSRISIYTGLPGVVGWEWHQQQQRAAASGLWVSQRILEVDEFYNTIDLGRAQEFLRKYRVRYIILGQQERGKYPGPGLEKFEAADGALWREVFRDRETAIYEVMEPIGVP